MMAIRIMVGPDGSDTRKFKGQAMATKIISRFRGSPFAFPLAAAVALAMFFISETTYRQAASSLDSLRLTDAARTSIQTLRRDLADAETGQRGYLLTERTEYLAPYHAVTKEVRGVLDSLHRYYDQNEVGAKLMQRIDEVSRAKLSELATTLRLHAEGNSDAWHELLMSNIGKEQMDSVRGLSDQLLQLESAKVSAVRKGIDQTLRLSRIGITAMTALSLLALFMYLRKTNALDRQREEHQQRLERERDQLEREVLRRTGQLTELTRHLQTVREDERNRLARELHDELGALLTAAKLDLARLKSRLGTAAPEVAERLAHLNEALNNGIALKRRIVEDLWPSALSNLGLVATLEILLQEFHERTSIAVHGVLDPVNLAPSGQLTVYRLLQEALTNTLKYARASEVRVELHALGGRVRVSVRDNGVGFDTETPRASTHGLLGMRYRIEAEGGHMTLTSSPGQGTLIEVSLPESVPAPASEHASDEIPALPA
jgi:signal transduction histidine kinase